jgi:hypothetical protein
MFVPEPAPKSRPTPSDVIPSVASRFLGLPEIVALRFPVGTRSRRISPRICPNTGRATTDHFASKPVGICTYINRRANARKISTYKISRLKIVQNQHLQKNRRGRAIPVRRNFVAAACPSSEWPWPAPGFPGARSFAFCAKGGIRLPRRLRKHKTNSIPEPRYQRQNCELPRVTPATLVECALTQKGGGGAAFQRHAVNP